MFLIIFLYSLAGLSFTIGKITLEYCNPLFYTAARMTVGGALLLTFLYGIMRLPYRLTKEALPTFLQVITFGIALPYSLRAWGLQHTTANKAAFIGTLLPFFTALFAYLFHKTPLTLRKTTGLILGFLGMIPTFALTNGEQLGSLGFFSLPEIAVLASVASFGYNFVALSTLINRYQCPPLVANALTMFTGGLITFGVAGLLEPVWIIQDPLRAFAFLAAQIVLSNIVILNLQATLIKRHSPTLMAFGTLLIPLSAAVANRIFLGEEFFLSYLISFVMVFAGLVLYYYDELRHLQSAAPTDQ